MKLTKEQRIEIFEDTKQKALNVSTPSVRPTIDFTSNDTVTETINRFTGSNTVISLVFASGHHFGGGCRTGAKAQEEDIFLCSNLISFEKLYEHKYPIHEHPYMISNAKIIKRANFEPCPDVPFHALFAAAPNLRKHDSVFKDPLYHDDYQRFITDNIRKMALELPNSYQRTGDTYLILGAWGCGVFENDPNVIAKGFKDNIDLFGQYGIDHIVFAIPDQKILSTFKRILES